MSVLLVSPPSWLGETIVERLIGQQDQVRVLLPGDLLAEGRVLETRGAHVAYGDATNGDLLERAAQGCRTIVAFDPSDELLEAAIEGARLAGVERIIVCSRTPSDTQSELVKAGGLEYVLMAIGRKGLKRGRLSAEAIGEAIDAADDLAGPVGLELKLTEKEAWRALRLQPR